MKKIKIILFSITFITFIFSCQTVPKQEKLQHDEFQTNLANYTLENGLPVVLKNSPESKVFTLEIYFPFGASNLDESNYGYLSFLLNLLTIENKNITREKMTEILDEKLADISYGSASDYCFIRMTCLSKYFDDIFKIFSDCVLYPSYKSFELMKSQSQFNFLNTKYIDYNLLMKKSGEKLREQTNYFGKNSFTSETILNLSLDKIELLYSKLFEENGIYILGSGNFSQCAIDKKLNSTFGKIKFKTDGKTSENEIKGVQNFVFEFKNDTIEIAENEKNITDFACGYKKLPTISENEKLFAACYIANLMYSDILYETVREQKGACYSVFSNMNLSKHPVLICVGYRITDKELFFEGIKDANKIFSQGKILSEGMEETIDACEKLESYKNILINRIYGDLFTSKQECSMMALSLALGGKTDFMENFASTINSVTERDLLEAIKYICAQDEQWFYLTSKKD